MPKPYPRQFREYRARAARIDMLGVTPEQIAVLVGVYPIRLSARS
ncbi:hypothetical protein AB0E04_48850 [Streptomyces sp. NPDC048251]